jgi:hypothetical protein
VAAQKTEAIMKKTPFTYGNPITDPTRFFGRQHEIE